MMDEKLEEWGLYYGPPIRIEVDVDDTKEGTADGRKKSKRELLEELRPKMHEVEHVEVRIGAPASKDLAEEGCPELIDAEAVRDFYEDEGIEAVDAEEITEEKRRIFLGMDERQEEDAAPAADPFDLREEKLLGSVESLLNTVMQNVALVLCRNILWIAFQDGIWRAIQTPHDMLCVVRELGRHCTVKIAEEMLHQLRAERAFVDANFLKKPSHFGIVSFRDGIWDARTGVFRERSVEDHVTGVLNLRHEETLGCRDDFFETTVRNLAGSELAHMRLQEMCGLALCLHPAGKLLYIQSVCLPVASLFAQLVSEAWSEDAAIHLSLRDLDRNFRAVLTGGKLICISTKDGEALVKDLETVLRVVDCDRINVERKHVDGYDIQAHTTIFCAGRKMPTVQTGGFGQVSHYVSRVVLTGDYPGDKNLYQLRNSVQAFVAWGMQGLQRYVEQGHLTDDPGSAIGAEFADLEAFVEQCVRKTPKGRFTSAQLEMAYEHFCEETGLAARDFTVVRDFVKQKLDLPNGKTGRMPGMPGLAYVYFGAEVLDITETMPENVEHLRRDICDNLDEDSDDIADGDDDPFGYMPQLEPSNYLF